MGDSGHLYVQLPTLQDSAATLSHLKDEFEQAGDIIGGDVEADLGSSDVWHAVHGFATDWKYHRQKLTEAMESIQKMAGDSHDTYVSMDDQLAKATQPKDSTGGTAA